MLRRGSAPAAQGPLLCRGVRTRLLLEVLGKDESVTCFSCLTLGGDLAIIISMSVLPSLETDST